MALPAGPPMEPEHHLLGSAARFARAGEDAQLSVPNANRVALSSARVGLMDTLRSEAPAQGAGTPHPRGPRAGSHARLCREPAFPARAAFFSSSRFLLRRPDAAGGGVSFRRCGRRWQTGCASPREVGLRIRQRGPGLGKSHADARERVRNCPHGAAATEGGGGTAGPGRGSPGTPYPTAAEAPGTRRRGSRAGCGGCPLAGR